MVYYIKGWDLKEVLDEVECIVFEIVEKCNSVNEGL